MTFLKLLLIQEYHNLIESELPQNLTQTQQTDALR